MLLPWRPWLLWQVCCSHSQTNRSLSAAPEICNPPDFFSLFFFFLEVFIPCNKPLVAFTFSRCAVRPRGARRPRFLHLRPVSLRKPPPSIPAPGRRGGFLFEAPRPPLPSSALPSASTACYFPITAAHPAQRNGFHEIKYFSYTRHICPVIITSPRGSQAQQNFSLICTPTQPR